MHLVMLQGEKLKNKHARVMFFVDDTSSEYAVRLCEASLKYL